MFGIFRTPRQMEDLALFARHVSGAMSARVPLRDILRAYLKDCERSNISKAVEGMIPRVESGVDLSAAMEENAAVFPEAMRRLVRLGEEGRTLEGTMDNLASTLEEGLKSYEQTRRAAIYPLLVTGALFVILAFLNVLVVPKFEAIFVELGAGDLYRGSTNLFGFQANWSYVLIGMNILVLIPIGLILAGMVGLRTRGFGSGRFLLQTPLVGPVMRLSETARFAHHLALLTENRVPMAEALDLIGKSSPTPYVREAIREFHRRYESGERLGDLVASQPLFPAAMAVMIASAEDQGGLARTLRKMGEFYADRAAHALVVVREILEPVLLLLVGLIVTMALFLIYSPLFSITRTL